ncbi:DUF2840 domain-containing protein [Bartonella sp. LJL80]
MTKTNQLPLTLVDLIWIEGKIEHWLKFANTVYEHRTDKNRRTVGLNPNEVFAFVRWSANDYGTVVSRLDIVQSVDREEKYQTIPFVRPGGLLLLKTNGLNNVHYVLDLITEIERSGINATEVSPDYWRHVHARLLVHSKPHIYTTEQHQAWLKRKKVGL